MTDEGLRELDARPRSFRILPSISRTGCKAHASLCPPALLSLFFAYQKELQARSSEGWANHTLDPHALGLDVFDPHAYDVVHRLAPSQ